jgi:hypothetical protein
MPIEHKISVAAAYDFSVPEDVNPLRIGIFCSCAAETSAVTGPLGGMIGMYENGTADLDSLRDVERQHIMIETARLQ